MVRKSPAILSNGTFSSLFTMLVTCCCSCSRLLGTVGMSAGMDIRNVAGGASGKNIQRDIQLPCQQIAGAQLRAHAIRDHAGKQAARRAFHIAHVFFPHDSRHGTEAVRVDRAADNGKEPLAFPVQVQIDRIHLPHGDAVEIHGRADAQSRTDWSKRMRIFSASRSGLARAVFLAIVDAEPRVRVRDSPRFIPDVLEREATHRERHQGLRADFQAIRAQAEIEAAGIPEACRGGDEAIIGRVDENLNVPTSWPSSLSR